MKDILSFGGLICLLESTIMSAFFEKTGAAIAFFAVGAGLIILAIWLEDREAKRLREEKRAERLRGKYQRRYQGDDDLEDAG